MPESRPSDQLCVSDISVIFTLTLNLIKYLLTMLYPTAFTALRTSSDQGAKHVDQKKPERGSSLLQGEYTHKHVHTHVKFTWPEGIEGKKRNSQKNLPLHIPFYNYSLIHKQCHKMQTAVNPQVLSSLTHQDVMYVLNKYTHIYLLIFVKPKCC